MNIIKLSATPSTNDFLKNLCASQSIENYTLVVAEHQIQGKGQRGSAWDSEPRKNLTFSFLIKNSINDKSYIFDLNVAVSVSIIEALISFKIPRLSIKWPNDILSEGKKISGILIENIFSGQHVSSIIGIGINVNQTNFENLPKASSLKKITQKKFDKEEIMLEIIARIKSNHSLVLDNKSDVLWEHYHNCLFRKDVPSVFEDSSGIKFMGIIKKVLRNGKIQIQIEKDELREFDLKEVRLIY